MRSWTSVPQTAPGSAASAGRRTTALNTCGRLTTIRDWARVGRLRRTSGLKQASTRASYVGREARSLRAPSSPPAATLRADSPLQCAVPRKGREEADGDGLSRVVRSQIRGGGRTASICYAEYRWGPGDRQGTAERFTAGQMTLVGRRVARRLPRSASCDSRRGCAWRRWRLRSMKHGNDATFEAFRPEASPNVALCPDAWLVGANGALSVCDRQDQDLRR